MTIDKSEIYRSAAEKYEMSMKNEAVQFSKDEVAALLEVNQMDLVELSDQDDLTRRDLMRLISIIPTNGTTRAVAELTKQEYDELINDYVLGLRDEDGEYTRFYRLQELSRKHSVSPRSLLQYALQNGWHQLRMSTSMQLADYQQQIAVAAIEQTKPRILLKSMQFCEQVLDAAQNSFDESDVEDKEAYVRMVKSMLTALKTDKNISQEKVEEFNVKLREIHETIQGNIEANLPSQGQTIPKEGVQDADFSVSDSQGE